ncbi:unnamed protein product, partial [Linum tenue]
MIGYRDFLDTSNRTHGVSQTTSLFHSQGNLISTRDCENVSQSKPQER